MEFQVTEVLGEQFTILHTDEHGLLRFNTGKISRFLSLEELSDLRKALDFTQNYIKENEISQIAIDDANKELHNKNLQREIERYERETGQVHPKNKPKKATCIYLIQNTITENLKIGASKNPKKRLNQLNIASDQPLKLLGICDGFEDDEYELHEKFKHLNLNTEWYKYSDEILKEFQIL